MSDPTQPVDDDPPLQRLRGLPSVSALLDAAPALIDQYGRPVVVDALRAVLTSAREQIRTNAVAPVPTAADLLAAAGDRLRQTFMPSLRPVINATGIVLHTNLGRAPLSEAAQAAVLAIASGYSTLEYDVTTGKRGSRLVHAETLLRQITGAEAALVVNNTAAGVMLALSALARGKDVIVSRGQLVEIGGGFRVPDVLRQSGARLVEVGTTNRTRPADFERAITPETAALLRVHSSNFKQIGFVADVPIAALARIAHAHDRLAIDDLGSGALLDTAAYGLAHEPTVGESVAAGMDVIAFSGDKLLGGPQCGIVIGSARAIEPLKKHPLARAFRADKLTLAALTATLDHYRRGDAPHAIPVWRMIALPLAELRRTAETWAAALADLPLRPAVIAAESAVGGGSLPGATLPTAALALYPASADAFTAALRTGDPPIIARVQADTVLIDPRTVLPGQEAALLAGLRRAAQSTHPTSE